MGRYSLIPAKLMLAWYMIRVFGAPLFAMHRISMSMFSRSLLVVDVSIF
jgi:hypothetical protein